MRVKGVTLFYAPSPLLLSLSCEVLCQSKRSRRENFIFYSTSYDLCKIADEMIWRICGKYWGDFHKIFYNLSAASIVRDCPFDY